jgi:glycosyltransferase involved in cell wall biosynthesis
MPENNSKIISKPRISIGLPVYNGEKLLHKSIDSILSQTFTDFELIISDNASTDSTSVICKEYVKKDKRIRYVKQKRNLGVHGNYFFLLNEAKFKYFLWVASDDYLSSNYLEENLRVLVNDENVVSSVGKVIPFGPNDVGLNPSSIETAQYPKFLENYIRMNRRRKMVDTGSVSGSFDKKIRTFLKITKSLRRWYGIHRTEQLKNCIISKPFINVEVSIFLNLLKMGDFVECDKTHLYEFDEGISSRGIINTIKVSKHDFIGTVFPFQPFTSWCLKNLGLIQVLKNLDTLILMNLGGEFALAVDIYLKFSQFFFKK